MNERRLGSKWDVYASNVVPAAAGDVQVKETRRAFYGGAAALFEILMSRLELGAEPTDNDFRLLDGLKAELDGFIIREIKAGGA